MHLLPSVAIQPNLELKTRPKQLLGSLLLVIALPLWPYLVFKCGHWSQHYKTFYSHNTVKNMFDLQDVYLQVFTTRQTPLSELGPI